VPPRRHLAFALLAGLALRALFIAHHARFGGDTLVYGDLAHNMLAHHIFGFTEDTIRSTLIRLPGYPIFLAACFTLFGTANYLAVLWVQTALDLATCILLAALAKRLCGERAAIATLWIAALCPFTANYAAVALTEVPCFFAAALAFFAFERWLTNFRRNTPSNKWAAFTGFALIAGLLLRPDQALVAVAIVPAMLWTGLRSRELAFPHRVLPTLIATLFIVLPLSLWAARNWHVYHVFQPLAPRYANDPGESNPYGFQRWYRTWAIDFKSTFDVYWVYDGGTVDMKDLPARAFDTPAQRAATAQLYAQYNDAGAATQPIDNAFAALADQRIAAHPLRYYIALPTARVLNMWLRPRTELMRAPIDFWNFRAHSRASIAECAYAALNAVLLLAAIAGIFRWRHHHWSNQPALAFAMLGFIALRCALLLTLDNSEPRYTLECYPIVILLAGLYFACNSESTGIPRLQREL
jgi:4-amino-4-deoxy-L-arabinose transferase-like glycosyltransferase